MTGSDADGDTLTYTITKQPSHRILSGTAPNLTYTPDKDYLGNDSFTFKVIITAPINFQNINWCGNNQSAIFIMMLQKFTHRHTKPLAGLERITIYISTKLIERA